MSKLLISIHFLLLLFLIQVLKGLFLARNEMCLLVLVYQKEGKQTQCSNGGLVGEWSSHITHEEQSWSWTIRRAGDSKCKRLKLKEV